VCSSILHTGLAAKASISTVLTADLRLTGNGQPKGKVAEECIYGERGCRPLYGGCISAADRECVSANYTMLRIRPAKSVRCCSRRYTDFIIARSPGASGMPLSVVFSTTSLDHSVYAEFHERSIVRRCWSNATISCAWKGRRLCLDRKATHLSIKPNPRLAPIGGLGVRVLDVDRVRSRGSQLHFAWYSSASKHRIEWFLLAVHTPAGVDGTLVDGSRLISCLTSPRTTAANLLIRDIGGIVAGRMLRATLPPVLSPSAARSGALCARWHRRMGGHVHGGCGFLLKP